MNTYYIQHRQTARMSTADGLYCYGGLWLEVKVRAWCGVVLT